MSNDGDGDRIDWDQMRADLGSWPLHVRLWLGVAVLAAAALLVWLQVPLGRRAEPPRPFLQAGPGDVTPVVGEQSDVLDPSVLFLPSPYSHATRVLASVKATRRSELFPPFEGTVVLGAPGFSRPAPQLARLPGVGDLTRPSLRMELASAGTDGDKPGAAHTPVASIELRRVDGPEVRRLELPLEPGTATGAGRPSRWSVRVEAGRGIGGALQVESSGETASDAVARKLVAAAVARAHPLLPGLWEIIVVW